jgi:hypothetical protein
VNPQATLRTFARTRDSGRRGATAEIEAMFSARRPDCIRLEKSRNPVHRRLDHVPPRWSPYPSAFRSEDGLQLRGEAPTRLVCSARGVAYMAGGRDL